MRFDIRPVPSPEADPVGFEALAAVYRESLAERDPDDPPPSRREVVADLFDAAPDRSVRNLLATVDGEAAGLAWASTVSEPGDELQVAEAEVAVRPPFRRRGVATALAAELIPALVELGQTSVMAFSCAEVTPEASANLCRMFGLTARSRERCSRARVADIDDDLLDRWIDDAATGAPGYWLERWEGVCPDELAGRWSQAAAAMEDEPLDDLDYNPHTRPAEIQRQVDEMRIARGLRIYRTLALAPDGEAAGLTALFVHEDRPQLGHQGDTGVLAAHRGHGLGRWMKAANYRQVRDRHPELAVIQTYNAESNPWMLDINVAMGFAPHHSYTGYQGSIETAARALG